MKWLRAGRDFKFPSQSWKHQWRDDEPETLNNSQENIHSQNNKSDRKHIKRGRRRLETNCIFIISSFGQRQMWTLGCVFFCVSLFLCCFYLLGWVCGSGSKFLVFTFWGAKRQIWTSGILQTDSKFTFYVSVPYNQRQKEIFNLSLFNS